ncbi:uncharacterized protein LOC141648743 [Silene latifolia]|uniref:uncharacterized protein LOC141648743 n=1 Tax=Silene latifolia TaxID=37657 RepID=UPI003D77E123
MVMRNEKSSSIIRLLVWLISKCIGLGRCQVSILIKEHIGWKPGIDSNLNVWDKKWVNGRTPEPKDCLLEEGFIFLKDLRVKDICINNGGWNEDLINLLFAEESVNHILAIPLHSSQPRDEIFWPFTSSGIYTVKSGYMVFFSAIISMNMDLERTKLGSMQIGSSSAGRNYGICRDLRHGKSFSEIFLLVPYRLVVSDSVETLDHLFRDCPLSSRIWAGSGLGITVCHAPIIDVRDWIVNWILYLSKLEDGLNLVLHFLVTLVSLWTLRNDIRFRGQIFNPGVFYSKTRQLFKEVLQATDKINNDPLHPPGFETGVSVSSSEDDIDYQMLRAGRPFYYGETRYEGFLRGRAESPLQAEALGLKEAISWARQAGVLHIEVSSDCLSLLTYVRRDCNFRAHALAQQAMSLH